MADCDKQTLINRILRSHGLLETDAPADVTEACEAGPVASAPGVPRGVCTPSAAANNVAALAESTAATQRIFPSHAEYHEWLSRGSLPFPPFLVLGTVRVKPQTDWKAGLRSFSAMRALLKDLPRWQAGSPPVDALPIGANEWLASLPPALDGGPVNSQFPAIFLQLSQNGLAWAKRSLVVTIGNVPGDSATTFDNGPGLQRTDGDADQFGDEEGYRTLTFELESKDLSLVIPLTRRRPYEDLPAVRNGRMRQVPFGPMLPVNVRVRGFPTGADYTVKAAIISSCSEAAADLAAGS